jgi:hypothetical protein
MGGYWPAQNETSGTEEWQGAVATPADLPTTAQLNETREVADDGDGQAAMYSWDGSTWIKIADPDAASVVDLQTAYTGSATPTPVVFTAAKHLTFTGSTSGSWAWTAETMALTQTGTGQVTCAGNVDATNGLDVSTAALTASAGLDVSAGTVALGTALTAAAGSWYATSLTLSASDSFTVSGVGNSFVETTTGTLNIGGTSRTTTVTVGSTGARLVYVGSLTTTAGTYMRAGTNGFQVDSNGSMSFDSKNTSNLTMTADSGDDRTLTIRAINDGGGDAFINIQADNGATVTGDLTVTGALATAALVRATVSKSAAYTILVSDYAIEAQTGAGAYDLTLPTLASATAGEEHEVTRCGTNLIRLVGNNGAELISGVNAQPLNAQWDSIKVRCNAAKTYWMKV